MAVRTATAAAVLTAAVAVYALARRDRRLRRQLARERASYRLMSGCLVRDLDTFRRRMHLVVAQQAVLAAAGLVLDDALAHHDHSTPPTEGGPR
jgi:hypothetical protein